MMSVFNAIIASVFYLRHENPLFSIIVGGIFGAAAGFFPRAKISADEDDDKHDDEEDADDDASKHRKEEANEDSEEGKAVSSVTKG